MAWLRGSTGCLFSWPSRRHRRTPLLSRSLIRTLDVKSCISNSSGDKPKRRPSPATWVGVGELSLPHDSVCRSALASERSIGRSRLPESFAVPLGGRAPAYGFLNGTATMTALLDGNPIPVKLFGTKDNYEWRPFIIWSSTPGSRSDDFGASSKSQSTMETICFRFRGGFWQLRPVRAKRAQFAAVFAYAKWFKWQKLCFQSQRCGNRDQATPPTGSWKNGTPSAASKM